MIALVIAGRAVFAQETVAAKPAGETAVAEWDSPSHDFGKIKQGIPVTHEFKFVNTGKAPIIITNVTASCGCTTPAWTHDAVMPGQSGFVKATFSAASMGAFDKTVTVTANVEQGSFQLKIRGEVSEQIVQ